MDNIIINVVYYLKGNIIALFRLILLKAESSPFHKVLNILLSFTWTSMREDRKHHTGACWLPPTSSTDRSGSSRTSSSS